MCKNIFNNKIIDILNILQYDGILAKIQKNLKHKNNMVFTSKTDIKMPPKSPEKNSSKTPKKTAQNFKVILPKNTDQDRLLLRSEIILYCHGIFGSILTHESINYLLRHKYMVSKQQILNRESYKSDRKAWRLKDLNQAITKFFASYIYSDLNTNTKNNWVDTDNMGRYEIHSKMEACTTIYNVPTIFFEYIDSFRLRYLTYYYSTDITDIETLLQKDPEGIAFTQLQKYTPDITSAAEEFY